MLIRLRATVNNQYVRAVGGGDAHLIADRSSASLWETFNLINHTVRTGDASLRSGDVISLLAYKWKYVCASGGGGADIVADRLAIGGWERFQIVRLAGPGIISFGDAVAIRTASGHYFCAESAGAAQLNATRTAIGGWESFQIERGRQYKSLSLTGSMEGGSDGNRHINAYRFRDNVPNSHLSVRKDVQTTNSRFVKLWVQWHRAQPQRPADLASSWASLRASPEIQWLDAELKAANDDGARVILTISQYFPQWSAQRNVANDPAGRDIYCKYPDDVSTNGPYGWLVAFLCERYRPMSPTSPNGAYADFLEPVNEPNWAIWPQYDSGNGNNMALIAAAMMDTAQRYVVALGGPCVLGPATSDVPELDRYFKDRPAVPENLQAYGCMNFTLYVANYLEIFGYGASPPARYMGWSHHNYRDVKYGGTYEFNGKAAWRVRHVLDILRAVQWWDVATIWLTEGGYELDPNEGFSAAELAKQADLVAANFRGMQAEVPEVVVWTQHQVNNRYTVDGKQHYGIRGLIADIVAQPNVPRDPPWPLYASWRDQVGG